MNGTPASLSRRVRRFAWAAVCGVAALGGAGDLDSMKTPFQWRSLPAIPDREGFAGPFAGVTGGALVVTGGANFPDKRPWEGGTKVWYDRVFVLEKPDGAWTVAGRLPQPLGYGVSVDTGDGIVCAGGSNARGHFADVFRLALVEGKIVITPLPPLPQPCANMGGALVGHMLYIAGGIATPEATAALKTFWALDLGNARAGWRELEPWPGPGRMLSATAACDGSFFLLGGTALHAGRDGKPERDYLRDAYVYTPGRGWRRIAGLPRASVAAPSPAPVIQGRVFLLGGDDGTQVHTPPGAHRGFPRGLMVYDPKTDAWSGAGDMPMANVVVPCVAWRGGFVIPNGEGKPGIRSPEVWTFAPPSSH